MRFTFALFHLIAPTLFRHRTSCKNGVAPEAGLLSRLYMVQCPRPPCPSPASIFSLRGERKSLSTWWKGSTPPTSPPSLGAASPKAGILCGLQRAGGAASAPLILRRGGVAPATSPQCTPRAAHRALHTTHCAERATRCAAPATFTRSFGLAASGQLPAPVARDVSLRGSCLTLLRALL